MNAHVPTPIFVRVSSVQDRFGLHRATIYRAAKRGEITIHRRGSMSFVEVAEIAAWITGENKVGDRLGG